MQTISSFAGSFVLQLAALDVVIDIYENQEDNRGRHLAYFGECQLFWDREIAVRRLIEKFFVYFHEKKLAEDHHHIRIFQ